MGKLRWEGARPDAGRDEAVEIAWGNFVGKDRDWMLDGMRLDAGRDKAVEIAWENFAGRERNSMLDGTKTVENGLGKLRWEGARPDA